MHEFLLKMDTETASHKRQAQQYAQRASQVLMRLRASRPANPKDWRPSPITPQGRSKAPPPESLVVGDNDTGTDNNTAPEQPRRTLSPGDDYLDSEILRRFGDATREGLLADGPMDDNHALLLAFLRKLLLGDCPDETALVDEYRFKLSLVRKRSLSRLEFISALENAVRLATAPDLSGTGSPTTGRPASL